MAPVVCLENGSEPCQMAGRCVSRNVFQKIENAVNRVIDNISLAELLKEDNEIGGLPDNGTAVRNCERK